jgi:hypothetical protein
MDSTSGNLIGVFFCSVGARLLIQFAGWPLADRRRARLIVHVVRLLLVGTPFHQLFALAHGCVVPH